MTIYEVGRVCVKTMGRESGSYCVVVEHKADGYVIITGPKNISGVRRRSCNTHHLEPIELKVTIKSGADDKDVTKALEEAGLVEKFRTKVRL